MQRAYSGSTLILNAVLVLLGLTLIVSTLARGGGPLALGVLAGLCLGGLGAGRLWLVLGARAPRR
jgi:hypothetical protein